MVVARLRLLANYIQTLFDCVLRPSLSDGWIHCLCHLAGVEISGTLATYRQDGEHLQKDNHQ